MVRRTTPQAKADDNAFPIRVKFAPPYEDIRRWWGIHARLTAWINELGPLRCVNHSAWSPRGQSIALYFRTLEDAQACVAAFPELDLADGVGGPSYYAPGAR